MNDSAAGRPQSHCFNVITDNFQCTLPGGVEKEMDQHRNRTRLIAAHGQAILDISDVFWGWTDSRSTAVSEDTSS